ncbi:hypothetical protein QRD43_03515 [Pelomonas sp. APW6]|uniref:Uncharacterized protein n=1 Tax=Roseateles subflavus TaxID=3053353 RepID=A0ABT7LDL3_9BURK|nr:hypothetical protein [Pelomonas sp. APW6]MDL5030964.1 hypothetical protein [Pelomonas sp. APW6]
MATASVRAPDITTKLFGGVFDVDGSGHYPGLELINFVVCCAEGTLPDTPKVHVHRAAHDFARQLITEQLDPARKASVLLNEHTAVAVGHLLRCLELEVPNAVKAKGWERTHFFPYTRSLVHWDARKGRQAGVDVQIERRYLRGAGAYAFAVLRRDPDQNRLRAMREGFDALYPRDRDSPLELLAATLRSKGRCDPEDAPSLDQVEAATEVRNDSWEELFRDGMRNILGHIGQPAVQRARAVMAWTSIWLALVQASRALALQGGAGMAIVVDCAGTHPQLRRAAQRCLKDIVGVVEQVSREEGERQGHLSGQQLGKIRAFFGNTAAAGGLLNSWKGRRHFTLKLSAIEALVLAAVPAGTELEFEKFMTQWLFERCGIVAGREGAARAGMLMAFDGTIFEENERRLADQMRAAGLLKVFSDATRMVSPGGRN